MMTFTLYARSDACVHSVNGVIAVSVEGLAQFLKSLSFFYRNVNREERGVELSHWNPRTQLSLEITVVVCYATLTAFIAEATVGHMSMRLPLHRPSVILSVCLSVCPIIFYTPHTGCVNRARSVSVHRRGQHSFIPSV